MLGPPVSTSRYLFDAPAGATQIGVIPPFVLRGVVRRSLFTLAHLALADQRNEMCGTVVVAVLLLVFDRWLHMRVVLNNVDNRGDATA